MSEKIVLPQTNSMNILDHSVDHYIIKKWYSYIYLKMKSIAEFWIQNYRNMLGSNSGLLPYKFMILPNRRKRTISKV